MSRPKQKTKQGAKLRVVAPVAPAPPLPGPAIVGSSTAFESTKGNWHLSVQRVDYDDHTWHGVITLRSLAFVGEDRTTVVQIVKGHSLGGDFGITVIHAALDLLLSHIASQPTCDAIVDKIKRHLARNDCRSGAHLVGEITW